MVRPALAQLWAAALESPVDLVKESSATLTHRNFGNGARSSFRGKCVPLLPGAGNSPSRTRHTVTRHGRRRNGVQRVSSVGPLMPGLRSRVLGDVPERRTQQASLNSGSATQQSRNTGARYLSSLASSLVGRKTNEARRELCTH